MKRSLRVLAFAAALVAVIAGPAAAQGSASARLASPGEEHAWLGPSVGTWDVSMVVFPAADTDGIPQPPMTATRDWILDGRYLRETLRGGDRTLREGTIGFNRLDGRFELLRVDVFEPGQMAYLGRGGATPSGLSLFGESTEAGMGPNPTGRRRDLRFEIEIEIAGPDENVERIFVTYPGQREHLFVEQRFVRAD